MAAELPPLTVLGLAFSEIFVNAGAVSRRLRSALPAHAPSRLGADAVMARAAEAWNGIREEFSEGIESCAPVSESALRRMAVIAHDLHLFVSGHIDLLGREPGAHHERQAAADTWVRFGESYERALGERATRPARAKVVDLRLVHRMTGCDPGRHDAA